MKKEQLARQLAKESRISPAAAADQVDRVVTDILMRIRKGEAANLPGLGTFSASPTQDFRFDSTAASIDSVRSPQEKR